MKFDVEIRKQDENTIHIKNNTYNTKKDYLRFNLKNLTNKEKKIYRSIRNQMNKKYNLEYNGEKFKNVNDIDMFKKYLKGETNINGRYMEDSSFIIISSIH